MTEQSSEPLSLVAIGAHMDDCWLGMGATALKAARRGHKVTLVQAVSTYGAWPTVAGRGAEVKELTERVAAQNGIRLITLGYDYMRIENNPATLARLAAVIAGLRPDVLFNHWEDDSNQDHCALGAAARIATMHLSCFRPPEEAPTAQYTRQIFRFEVDHQTRNFTPDTFVNVTEELYDALEICALFADLYARTAPGTGDHRRLSVMDHRCGDRKVSLVPYTEEKLAHAILFGTRSGCRYAEGFRSYKNDHVGRQLLGRI
jgi:LmbE family N-acetylglucosaminyl deacetylase